MDINNFLMISLADLERLTGIHKTSWSAWFKAKNSPKLETLEAIAQKLDMPPDELIKAFMIRRDKNSLPTPPSQ